MEKGRVTIFALAECPHCKRAKGALTKRGIPYQEISLSTHPSKRTDMLSLADRLSVPQVFFNEKHIGGADETLALLEKWDEEGLYPTALERYQKEVESQSGPTDPRLAIPTTPPVVEKPPPPRNESEDMIKLPGADGQTVTVFEIIKTLIKKMPCKDRSYRLKTYKNSFKGSEGVKFFMMHYGLSDVKEAVSFGQMLQKRKILDHVTMDHDFDNNDNFFRIQPYMKPKVLNSFRVWVDRVESDAMALLNRLNKLMGSIISKATDGNGYVDYLAAAEDEKYFTFEENVCELQGVSMASMDDKTKLAFGINLYNLMIKYAFIKLGTPDSDLARDSFFSNVSINIGGDVLSFKGLENGILRGNKKPPYQPTVKFLRGDPRLKLVLSKPDPRIHFGLNCGAKSCPPVKKFTVDAIEEELRIVALAFCEQSDNVIVDDDKCELHLSTIFNWYQSDFADSKSKLVKVIVTYLRGDSKEKLQKMIESKKDIKVKYIKYDWGTNALKSKTYSSNFLQA
mmetsp:Transcript_3416/g.4506  ORF Transcript_3416/g.4506 Transcript_3416/m.4506 type:complete len:510 (-) Transcript_3416:240-1769(-)